MKKLVVEVGMKLEKKLSYYVKMLKKHGLKLVYKTNTHDIYYTNLKNFDGLTENQIKTACIRLRNPKKSEKGTELLQKGYYKVFDTKKKDFQFANNSMKSRIQLQVIKDVGLLVYYDNPDYYHLPLKEQRKKLLEELNSYGFCFKESDLGLDKLRTLYYNQELFSENQNG